MKDPSGTDQERIEEISALKQRIRIPEQPKSKRKKTDQALMHSEEKYRTLIENIQDGIYTLDSFGKITFVNDVILKRSGFPVEWFLGRSYLDFIIKEDHERVQRYFNSVMDGKTEIYDLSYPVKSGNLLHIEVCTAPLFDGAKVIGLLGVSRDNTNRRKVEKALRKGETRFRAIADYTSDWENWVGTDGKLLWVNPMVFKVTGYSVQECLDMNDFPSPIIHEADRERVTRAFRFAVQESSGNNLEFRIICKDGSIKWGNVSWQPIYDEKGCNLGYRSSIRDINDHKLMELSLREAEKKYHDIFENSAEGLYQVAPGGRFITANTAAAQILGYDSPEELISTVTDIGSQVYAYPEDYEKALQFLKKDGFFKNFEVRTRKKNGNIIWVIASVHIVRDDEGNILYHEGTSRDITDRKRAEEKLRRNREVTERLAKEIAIIAEIGRVTSSTLNIQEVYESFAREVRHLIPFDRFCVAININPQEDTFQVGYVNGMEIPGGGQGDIEAFRGSFTEVVMETRQGFISNFKNIEDLSRRFPTVNINLVIYTGFATMMSIPVLSRNEVIGIINFWSSKPNAYTKEDLHLAERVGHQIAGAIANAQAYDQLRQTHDILELRVKERTVEMEEINTALQVLLKKREEDRKNMEQAMLTNINELVTPFLDKIKTNLSGTKYMSYLNIIETNLSNIISPFANELSEAHRSLTPKEIQIASLVKLGKSSKEIAQIFGVSVGTVMTHRNNIRKKLKLKSKNSNLRSHLLFHN